MNSPRNDDKLDLTQAIQMLRWLDDEHRKDKILMAEMQKRIDDQKELIINQGRRLEELEARITQTQSALYKFDQIEVNMQQTRGEASALLPKFEHELHAALERTAQARALALERDSRLVQELRTQLEPIPDIRRRLDALVLEDRRLNEQFPPLHVKQEQLAAALEVQISRFQYLEEWGERIVKQVAELKLIEGRIKADHAVMLEAIRRSEEDQRQQLSQWAQEIVDHRKTVDAAIAALPPVGEVYDQARRALAHLEGLDDEIRDEQAKVAHLLELSEQRTKETLAAWRSEHEKNWEQHITMFDLYRKQQREISDAIIVRLDALEQVDVEQTERWTALRETWVEQSKRQMMEVERMQKELETSILGKKRKRSGQ